MGSENAQAICPCSELTGTLILRLSQVYDTDGVPRIPDLAEPVLWGLSEGRHSAGF